MENNQLTEGQTRYRKYRDSYQRYRKTYIKQKPSGVAKLKANAATLAWAYKKEFGGLREKVILRDSEACLMCGMTRKEHRIYYNRDITVDHIDGNGRYSQVKNNAEENLQTLCLKCHSSKDRRRTLKLKK